MTIYTKTGDKGVTGLWGGKRVKKSHKIIEAIGSIDELNAWMGVLAEGTEGRAKRAGILSEIQDSLMMINAAVAGHKAQGIEHRVEELEKEIDRMESELPKLHNFILPRGKIHVIRAICRRAERRVAPLFPMPCALFSLKYLNRLSDYLFVLARYEDFKKGKKEVIWKR